MPEIKPQTRNVTTTTAVEITINDREPIERCLGDAGKEWREHMGAGRDEGQNLTEEDVLKHWAFNASSNNIWDISELDGWADVEKGVVTMRAEVIDVEVER
jgi:hypothetical protein